MGVAKQRHVNSSMIVRDLDVQGVPIHPSKTDTPLIIDPNAQLPSSRATP
jgi:hypothetical protein